MESQEKKLVSDAKKRADAKWRAKAYEPVSIQVRKGTREVWKQAAQRHGMSLASYIKQAVIEKMECEQ